MYKYHKKLSRRFFLRLSLFLFIDLKAHRTRVIEVTVEFKVYIKAAVLVFVYVYLADEQAQIRIRDVRLEQHLVEQLCCGHQFVAALLAEFVKLPAILYLLRQLR